MPIVFVLMTGSKDPAVIGDSKLVETAFEQWNFGPDFRLDVDLSAPNRCQGNLLCLVKEVDRTWARRWSAHEAGRYIIMVTRRAQPGSPDLMTVSLLDAQVGMHLSREAEVIEQALLLSVAPRLIKDEATLRHYFRDVFSQIKETLTAKTHQRLFGQLTIDMAQTIPDLQVYLDGTLVGDILESTIDILCVQPGHRRVTLRQTNGQQHFETRIHVQPGATLNLKPDIYLAPPLYAQARTVVSYSGWGALAIGLGISSYGLYTQVNRNQQSTILPPQNSMRNRVYELDASRESRPNGWLAVGLGLVGVGLGSNLGLAWFGDAHEPPWLQIALGTVLGGALFGLTWSMQ